MQNLEKVETLNSQVLINEATNASSVQHFNGVPQDAPNSEPQYVTTEAIIEGQTKEVIVAFSRYNMQVKVKENIFKLAEPEKMLRVIYHFSKPEVFWGNNIELFDRDGNLITPGTENVLVHMDTASTSGRILCEKVLSDIEIHEYATIEEYAQAVGNTMLLSRGLNTIEKVGYAALATGDKTTMAIFDFATKNKIPMSVAEDYLQTHLRPTTVLPMTVGKKPAVTLILGRSPEEAQELFDQMVRTFTKGSAGKRYAIRVVNSLFKDNKFTKEDIMTCLRTIPANDVSAAELMDCGIREACIASVLTTWLIKLQRNEVKVVG